MPQYAGRSRETETIILPSTKDLPAEQQCKVWGPKILDFPTRARIEDACAEWVTRVDDDGDEEGFRTLKLAKLLETGWTIWLMHKEAGWNLKKPADAEHPEREPEDWERDEDTVGFMLVDRDQMAIALRFVELFYPFMLGLPSADPNELSADAEPPSEATSEAEPTLSKPKTGRRIARSKQQS